MKKINVGTKVRITDALIKDPLNETIVEHFDGFLNTNDTYQVLRVAESDIGEEIFTGATSLLNVDQQAILDIKSTFYKGGDLWAIISEGLQDEYEVV